MSRTYSSKMNSRNQYDSSWNKVNLRCECYLKLKFAANHKISVIERQIMASNSPHLVQVKMWLHCSYLLFVRLCMCRLAKFGGLNLVAPFFISTREINVHQIFKKCSFVCFYLTKCVYELICVYSSLVFWCLPFHESIPLIYIVNAPHNRISISTEIYQHFVEWILQASNILRFQKKWINKSVWSNDMRMLPSIERISKKISTNISDGFDSPNLSH